MSKGRDWQSGFKTRSSPQCVQEIITENTEPFGVNGLKKTCAMQRVTRENWMALILPDNVEFA